VAFRLRLLAYRGLPDPVPILEKLPISNSGIGTCRRRSPSDIRLLSLPGRCRLSHYSSGQKIKIEVLVEQQD
jgi:hypothetical protein